MYDEVFALSWTFFFRSGMIFLPICFTTALERNRMHHEFSKMSGRGDGRGVRLAHVVKFSTRLAFSRA